MKKSATLLYCRHDATMTTGCRHDVICARPPSPRHGAPSSRNPTDRRWTERAIPPSSPADILLVDDSMCCRQSIGFALRRAGHQVREASSADAALRELERTGPPKVCIVDHIMADLDGACLIHILRQRPDTTHTAMVLMSPSRPTICAHWRAKSGHMPAGQAICSGTTAGHHQHPARPLTLTPRRP